MLMPRRLPIIVCLLGAGLAQAETDDAVADRHTDVVIGLETSRGLYGEAQATHITSVPVVLRHRQGRWTGHFELPWQRIESPAPVLPGVGPLDGAGAGPGVVQGLGDAWFKLGYEWQEYTHDTPGVDLLLKLKTRSGSYERGLGSGGTDLALQVELTRRIGPLQWFGHVGWRDTGDVAGARPYRNPWYGELGAALPLPGRCQAGLYHDLRQAIGSLGRLSETTAYAGCTVGAQRLQAYVTRGHGGASADLSLGMSVRHRF